MSRKHRSLRERLQAHDPAQGEDRLSPLDRARMRETILNAVRNSSTRRSPAVAVGTGLGMAAAALVGVFLMTQSPPARPRPAAGSHGSARRDGSPGVMKPGLQIQMVTPGGTRFVWILKSETD